VEVDFARVTFRDYRDEKLGEGEKGSDATCDGAHGESGGGGGRWWRASASGPMVFSMISL